MCTAIALFKHGGIFGRTLDVEGEYGQRVIVTPKGYKLSYLHEDCAPCRFSIVGMGLNQGKFPLYFDGMNEAGVFGAALRFPGLARYFPHAVEKKNIASFEILPFFLSSCESCEEIKEILCSVNVCEDSFSKELPASPLHWFFADKSSAITVESSDSGLSVYDNPVDVLTNSPEFPYHLRRLCDYASLSVKNPENTLSDRIDLPLYSGGMGAIGLPGDFSSSSRFTRGVFLSENAKISADFKSSLSAFFGLMGSLSVPLGCVEKREGMTYTSYTSCAHAKEKTYSFSTCKNHRIRTVKFDTLAACDRIFEIQDTCDTEDVKYLS